MSSHQRAEKSLATRQSGSLRPTRHQFIMYTTTRSVTRYLSGHNTTSASVPGGKPDTNRPTVGRNAGPPSSPVAQCTGTCDETRTPTLASYIGHNTTTGWHPTGELRQKNHSRLVQFLLPKQVRRMKIGGNPWRGHGCRAELRVCFARLLLLLWPDSCSQLRRRPGTRLLTRR
jgi:hypothetical protein